MGKVVISVDELRVVDPYMFRTDYFMGLSKRFESFCNPVNTETQEHSSAIELIKYLEFGYELNIVPRRTMEKVFDNVDDFLNKGEDYDS